MKNEQFFQRLRVINLLRFSLFTILPISSIFAQGPTPGELAEANKASTAALELFKQGKYQEALKPATQALEIRTKILGLDSPQTKSAQLDLAEINIALRKYEDAEVLLDQVIKWYKGRSPNDVALARILGRMALVQYVQGNLKRTTALYEDAIGILERVYGTNDERVVPALFNFAEYLQVTGNLERAEGLYKRLAATKENSSSQQRPGLSDVLDRYSCLLFKAGRAKEAQDMEMRAGLMPGVLPPPDRADAGQGTVLNGKAIS